MLAFPNDFIWGVATSAHQIEGALSAGGRGESIWDRFASMPGRIADGSDASTACDHYRRWREDLGLMQWLGVRAYRFSIAWPRVMPRGRGSIHAPGFDFYEALVDALLDAGILPFVTLYHWDLPQALQDRGGWSSRETATIFADYAAAVSERLGDRVQHWITHNEPCCVATLGHEEGEHAPGHRDPNEALRVSHHLLLSHGLAVQAIRNNAPDAEIGIALNLAPAWPATPGDADREAARRFDGMFNRWYLDPLYRGRYPDDVIADRVRRGHLEPAARLALPFVRERDLETIAAPLDFLGVNYYTRMVLQAGADGDPIAVRAVPVTELTDMGWEVFPQGLYHLLMRLQEEYKPPKIYITENGAAYGDGPAADGWTNDARRIAYMNSHLQEAHRAIADGAPLRGYFAWSLLDNFEWAHGYTKRFGLYWVDYVTQRRNPKASAYWYRDLITSSVLSDGAQQPTQGGSS